MTRSLQEIERHPLSLEETCRAAAKHARKMARQYRLEGNEAKAASRLRDAETYARWAEEERKNGKA